MVESELLSLRARTTLAEKFVPGLFASFLVSLRVSPLCRMTLETPLEGCIARLVSFLGGHEGLYSPKTACLCRMRLIEPFVFQTAAVNCCPELGVQPV